MKNRHQKDAAIPVQAASLKAFANLAGTVLLLLRACVTILLRSLVFPEMQTVWRKNKKSPALQWRRRRWAWQMLSLAIAVVTAPTFLFISALMAINAQCDYVLFWWSLPAIVIVGNAVAFLRTNHRQQRRGFATSSEMANYHVGAAMETGCVLFALAGWSSGLLPDLITLFSGSHSVVLSFLGSVVLSVSFAILSFSHAGMVYAWLGL